MRVVWVAVLASILLSACSLPGAGPTPTSEAEAIFTSAALTFAADQATLQAAATPTYTVTPPPVPTFAFPSPIATISFATPTSVVGGKSACDDALYVADVTVPDKTWFDPGKKFTKTWLVQNNGTCDWNTSYKLVFVDGTDMAGKETYLPLAVPVGKQVEVSVNLAAPTSPGDYYGRWRLKNDKEQAFGAILTVVIKVIPLSGTP
jgi:hypothetical protein